MTLVGDEVLAEEWDLRGNWWIERGWLLDAVVGLVAAVIFLVFLTEPQPVDPMQYLDGALRPGHGSPDHWNTRLGVLVPTWLVSQIFGHSEFTFYALPFLGTVVLASATSNLGRSLFRWWVGPTAALITVTAPFIFLYSAQLLPDVPSTALSTVSLAVMYRASRRTVARRFLPLLLAGLAFGGAFLMRDTAVLFLPGLMAAGLLWGLGWRGLVPLVVGAAIAPLFDFVGNAVIWGDVWARIEAVVGHAEGSLSEDNARSIVEAQSSFFKTFGLLPGLLWKSVHGAALLIGSALYLVVASIPSPKRRLYWALPAWTVSAWIIFALVATAQPDSGRVLIRLILDRYWAPFIPALALMAVAWVALLSSPVPDKTRRAIVVACVGIGSVMLAAAGINHTLASYSSWFVRLGAGSYWDLREALREMPKGTTLYVPTDGAPLVGIYIHDPVGRPIGIDMKGLEGEPDATAWYIFSVTSTMPETSDDETLPWPPEGYEVAATDARIRWVLFAPESADWDRVTVSEINPTGYGSGWQARLITSEQWEDPAPFAGEIYLDGNQDMVVYDNTAPFNAIAPDARVIPDDSLIAVDVEMELEHGLTALDCRFFSIDDPGNQVNVRASAMSYAPPFVGSRTWMCRVPSSIEGRVSVRPVLIVRSPADLQIGQAIISAHYPVP